MTILHWVLYFYVYCFLGWCIESTIVSVEQKRLVNRGFLRCPMLPLYGFGSITILLITLPVRDGNPFWIYFSGLVGATVLEYITAVLMETILKTKYWDYSNEKWNFQGRICVKASLFWGCLSLLLVYVINPPLQELCDKFSNTAVIVIDSVISVIFVTDTIISFKAAFDINKFLGAMSAVEDRIAEVKLQIDNIKLEKRENIEVEIAELKAKAESLVQQRSAYFKKISFFSKDMILSNPSMISKHFNETLESVKEKLGKK